MVGSSGSEQLPKHSLWQQRPSEVQPCDLQMVGHTGERKKTAGQRLYQCRDSNLREGSASQTKSCQQWLTSTVHVACWLKIHGTLINTQTLPLVTHRAIIQTCACLALKTLFSDYRLYSPFSDCTGNVRKRKKEMKSTRLILASH